MSYKKNIPNNFVTKIEVVRDPNINAILNLDADSYTYKVRFYGINKDKNLVEYTISYMKMDKVEFKIRYDFN